MSKGKLEFKVGARLKNIIGKDLITDDFIAVFELVKNSYDAHAKNVIITFEEEKIIIADNGKGMSFDDLKNKWLFVAYSAKEDGTEDLEFDNKKESYRDLIVKRRRHYAGAKGIGRFSCDRLGKKLEIITKKIGEDKSTILYVDWSKFEDDSKVEFQNIELDYEIVTNINNTFPHKKNYGTILKINKTEYWDRIKILQLKYSLEKLINPFSETDEFTIEIKSKREEKEDKKGLYKTNPSGYKDADLIGKPYLDRDKVNGVVKNSILEVLELKTTQISVEIEGDIIKTELKDRGADIYSIREQNKYYPLIDNLKLDLYYLNTSAKNNFTRKMGVSVVNFGSVFLFKNGFRVQPYGEAGDDSWELDYRAQQGHSRFLGTRDLFGRVDIITDKEAQFKEVTSRAGGLVETEGYKQLVNAFKENALKRLERYVVGVLWGEAFKRRNYFNSEKDAEIYRKHLQESDKYSDNVDVAKSNIGSKIDFIQLIKSLASDENIEIIEYNKEFVNLINEKIDEHQHRFISDLEKIAEKTDDENLKKEILRTEEQYQSLLKEKEAEEIRRIEAEKKSEAEERKRKEAEAKAQQEEALRKKAEIEAERKEKERLKEENKRILAENAQLKAEKKADEEKKKRELEEVARKKAESVAERRKEQLILHKSAKTVEYKDLRDSNHIIGVYSDDISKKILLLKRKLDKGKTIEKKELISFIQGISLANEKIATLTRFTTKSNFLKASLETEQDIVSYITNYITKTYQVLYRIDIDIISNDVSYIKKFQPIELSLVIDNIISNSRKKRASKVIFEFNIINNKLQISIKDIGSTLSDKIQDWNLIFEEGVTTTKGSGLGLNHVKRIIENDLKGKIMYNSNYTKGFELIITI